MRLLYKWIIFAIFLCFAVAIIYIAHSFNSNSAHIASASSANSLFVSLLGSGHLLYSKLTGAYLVRWVYNTNTAYHINMPYNSVSSGYNITYIGTNAVSISFIRSSDSVQFFNSMVHSADEYPTQISVLPFSSSNYSLIILKTVKSPIYPSTLIGHGSNYFVLANFYLNIPYGNSYNAIVSEIINYSISNPA
jgi:hypothetical protein